MKNLVINTGSSSLKYQLIDMEDEKVLASGYCEKVTLEGSFCTHKANGTKTIVEKEMPNHEEALKLMIKLLTTGENRVIDSIEEIDAVGHRIVHGGESFTKSALVTDEVIAEIEKCSELAPLHNPANLTGIKVAKKIFGDKIPMAVVFDTAFHQSMDKSSFLYALPYEYYEKYGVRRYGFHGTSHKYVSERAAAIFGRDDLKIISCHIGSGASICAIDSGKVIDTSMGFTPLEGLVMGTRSGNIDPAIIKYICEKENLTLKEMDTILNKKSGLLGISGEADMRDVQAKFKSGDELSGIAINVFERRIAKYIGSYIAALNGVDLIIFTAGVGENSVTVRGEILDRITCFGLQVDVEKNRVIGEEAEITTNDSKVKVWVIPTNEELMIARDTKELVESL